MKRNKIALMLILSAVLLPEAINMIFSATGIKLLYYISRCIFSFELLFFGLVLMSYFRPVLRFSEDDKGTRKLPLAPFVILFSVGLMLLIYGIQNFQFLIKTWNMECLNIDDCMKYMRWSY